MAVVELKLRITTANTDIEKIQDKVMDALYSAGFTRVEPIRVTLIIETDNPCDCGGKS